jgi:hypothetical protein
MPNQEITTALRNSIERGEDLQTAMQIMINSGYNPDEVQEASRYFGSVDMQAKPEEQLTMPSQKKGFFSKLGRKAKQPVQKQVTKPPQNFQPTTQVQQPQLSSPTLPQIPVKQEARQIKQEITESKPMLPQVEISTPVPGPENSKPLAKQLDKLTPKKNSHFKEIMLLIILLVLIGLLVLTILLKDTIIGWFS